MTAFSAVVDALFNDPNIGREAIYTSAGGAPVLVRIVSHTILGTPRKFPKFPQTHPKTRFRHRKTLPRAPKNFST